jgi:hypothetical protein
MYIRFVIQSIYQSVNTVVLCFLYGIILYPNFGLRKAVVFEYGVFSSKYYIKGTVAVGLFITLRMSFLT